MRRCLGFVFILILVFPAITYNYEIKNFSSKNPSEVRGKIISVDKEGNGDFNSIQIAIENASAGDTISIAKGKYQEVLTINKTLSLIGEGSDITSIGFLQISSDWCNISKLKISGIYVSSDHNHIFECNSSGGGIGLELDNAHYNTIMDSRFDSNGEQGIHIGGSYNKIINCICNNNGEYGIYLRYYHTDRDVGSNNNHILNCICSNNNNAGIYLNVYSSNNTMENCICNNNKDSNGKPMADEYGIHIGHSGYYNRIINCTCNYNNDAGIHICGSDRNEIINSTCESTIGEGSYSKSYGIWLYSVEDCIVESSSCNSNGIGLYLEDSYDNDIVECSFDGNFNGIAMGGISNSDGNYVRDCSFTNSKRYGVEIGLFCKNNYVFNNAFINNNVEHGDAQGYDDYPGYNNWDNGRVGNYWSDWDSPDKDRDGIVDKPYYLDTWGDDKAEDRFPKSTMDLETDTDGDGYPDYLDYYPEDPERWEEPEDDEEFDYWTLMIVLLLIIIVLAVVIIIIIRKRKTKKDE